MIEYNIRLESINREKPSVSVFLKPIDRSDVPELFKELSISDVAYETMMSKTTAAEVLDEVAKEVIRGDPTWQHEWNAHLDNIARETPEAFNDAIGASLTVTQASVDALAPAGESVDDYEVQF